MQRISPYCHIVREVRLRVVKRVFFGGVDAAFFGRVNVEGACALWVVFVGDFPVVSSSWESCGFRVE